MVNLLLFYSQTFNLMFAVGGLVLLMVTIVLLFDLFKNEQKLYKKYLEKYIWYLITIVSAGGVAITLLYSEVYGFVPCSLCWLQRMALYPQALLSIMAWKLQDRVFYPMYGIALSVFGLVVAIYQYVYQLLPEEVLEAGLVPCLADGSADCGQKIIDLFGFVTFPFLSGVLFVFLIVLYLHLYKSHR